MTEKKTFWGKVWINPEDRDVWLEREDVTVKEQCVSELFRRLEGKNVEVTVEVLTEKIVKMRQEYAKMCARSEPRSKPLPPWHYR